MARQVTSMLPETFSRKTFAVMQLTRPPRPDHHYPPPALRLRITSHEKRVSAVLKPDIVMRHRRETMRASEPRDSQLATSSCYRPRCHLRSEQSTTLRPCPYRGLRVNLDRPCIRETLQLAKSLSTK